MQATQATLDYAAPPLELLRGDRMPRRRRPAPSPQPATQPVVPPKVEFHRRRGEIAFMREEGWSYRSIVEILGLSMHPATLSRHWRKQTGALQAAPKRREAAPAAQAYEPAPVPQPRAPHCATEPATQRPAVRSSVEARSGLSLMRSRLVRPQAETVDESDLI